MLFDVVVIDTGGRLGPATGTIMRMADVVLIVIDDTILGLTAVDLYLTFVKTLVGSTDRLMFLVNPYSGALLGVDQIMAELEPAHHLGEAPWRLPPVPNDPKAALWPGSGRTLYSMGQKGTRDKLEAIARELGVIDPKTGDQEGAASGSGGGGGWLSRLFGRSGGQKAEVPGTAKEVPLIGQK